MLSFMASSRRRGDEVSPAPDPMESAMQDIAAKRRQDANARAAEKAKKVSVFGEIMVIVLALASIAGTSSSYSLMAKSAAYVEPILQNWQTKPVGYMVFAYPNGSCPAGTISDRTEMEWPGADSLGCACPNDSGMTSLEGSACDSNRLAAGCIDSTAMVSITMNVWRGTKICLNRTGEAVATFLDDDSTFVRPIPDAEVPHQCADGYRRCGRTNMDEWRATCTPEDDVCPLTFAGSDKMIGAYGATAASFEANSFSRALQPFYNQSSDNETLYVAESSLVVAQQLPLVQFLVSFMQDGSRVEGYDAYGPCLNYLADYTENEQASYDGTAVHATRGDPRKLRNQYPDSCDRIDPRWIAYDHQDETSLLIENVLNHEYCDGYNNTRASQTNYWYSGDKCSTDTSEDIAKQCIHGYDDSAPLKSCSDADFVCQDNFYQSKCGRLMEMVSAIDAQNQDDGRVMNIGLFKRTEIYWREECSSDYNSVKENDSPLRRALSAQTVLLGTNIFLNCITITVSTIVLAVYVFDVDLPCIDGTAKEDAAFLHVLNKRVSFVAKIFKLVPIVAAIWYLSYVVDFYTEVAQANCSDDITNESFLDLGTTLPSTQFSNYCTLGMDFLQIVMPVLLFMRKEYQSQQKIALSVRRRTIDGGESHRHSIMKNEKDLNTPGAILNDLDDSDTDSDIDLANDSDDDNDANVRVPERPSRNYKQNDSNRGEEHESDDVEVRARPDSLVVRLTRRFTQLVMDRLPTALTSNPRRKVVNRARDEEKL